MTLVVDGKRPAAVRQRAVVDDGHAPRRHALADAAREGGSALAVEIALETVADRLVQEHARPSRPQHDGHGASRRRTRVEIHERLLDRILRIGCETLVREVGVVETPTAARRTLLAPAVRFNDDLHGKPHQRAHVRRQHAVGARQQDHLVLAAEARHDLRHARIAGAAHAFDALQQRDLVGVSQARERVMRQIERRRAVALHHPSAALAPLPRDRPGCLRRRPQGRRADVVGIGEGGLLAAHRPHPHTLVDVEGAGFDDPLFEAPAFGTTVLEVQICVVDPVREDVAEGALEVGRVERVGDEQPVRRGLDRVERMRGACFGVHVGPFRLSASGSRTDRARVGAA